MDEALKIYGLTVDEKISDTNTKNEVKVKKIIEDSISAQKDIINKELEVLKEKQDDEMTKRPKNLLPKDLI